VQRDVSNARKNTTPEEEGKVGIWEHGGRGE